MDVPIDYREYRLQEAFCFLVGGTAYLLQQRLLKKFVQAGHDLTLEQWNVLIQLWSGDGRSQQELASCITKNQTFVTRLLDVMEDHKWVCRVDDANDRRVKLVYLTAEGRELTKILIELNQKPLWESLVGIKNEDIAVCRRVLLSMMTNLTPV